VVERALSVGLRGILRLPRPALRALAGPEKRNDRGDVLDLQTQAVLRVGELLPFPKAYEQTPSEARASVERESRLVDPSPPAMAQVEERSCDGPNGPVPLRIYRPTPPAESAAVLVYHHGGGHTIGSLASHDGVCRRLARGSGCVVVSVDYRLGPEHPFPAAIEDAAAAFEWVEENAAGLGWDPSRLAVGGDSAGGNLTAVICHRRRDAGRPQPALQLLIYPAMDLTRSLESHRLFARGYYLEKPVKDWFVANYLPSPELEPDPRASPLLAERFDGLAPALVVTAGFDLLRDEGEAYARRLREAGVEVTELHEPTLVHGFVNMAVLDAPAAARERIERELATALSAGR
jgi:acetyl esterase